MGAAASFGFGEPSAREKPRVDYNKLLKLSFYDFVQCDSTRRTLVSRGQRLVRYMMHFCPRADGRPNNRGASFGHANLSAQKPGEDGDKAQPPYSTGLPRQGSVSDSTFNSIIPSS